jgi:hypothetical protein
LEHTWHEFVNEVREPLKAFLKGSGLARKIRYIVPVYGVPSHIERHPYGATGLSVDAFLAIMSSRYADVIPMDNPAYSPDPQVMPRFPRNAYGGPYYIVSRLDGPSTEIAAGLVTRHSPPKVASAGSRVSVTSIGATCPLRAADIT